MQIVLYMHFVLSIKVHAIKELSDMITKLKRAGDGLGIHILDKEMNRLLNANTLLNSIFMLQVES